LGVVWVVDRGDHVTVAREVLNKAGVELAFDAVAGREQGDGPAACAAKRRGVGDGGQLDAREDGGGQTSTAAMNAATFCGMYGSRFRLPAALGYQSCITNERGFPPLLPGSRRDRSTSSIERVPTGYGPA
jgi:hypothetical protein